MVSAHLQAGERCRLTDVNVVFDLGGVVVRWDPDAVIRSVLDDARAQAAAKTHIFEHADWIALDRGTLELPAAVNRGAARSGLPIEVVAALLDRVPRSLTPIPDTLELVHALSQTDHRLYVLSNMHVASIEHLEANCDFWDYFDGSVISCRIHRVKPELEIFRHLLDAYDLDPAQTVFIDDVEENTAAATELGLTAMVFTGAGQCRQRLVELNVLS